MTLRKKTFVLITITTLLLIAIVLVLSNTIILGSFSRLEEKNIHQNALQTVRSLEDEIAKLESTLEDWAYWDDTYQFVTDGNDGYIDNNLNESSIVNLNLNFMVFTNVTGHIVYEKAVDLDSGQEMALPATLTGHIKNNAVLSRIEDESVVAGVILVDDFPVLIASAPVLNSLEEGPARGRMIVGRFFDASAINHIAEKLQLSLTLHRFDDRHLPEKLKKVADALHSGQSAVVNKLSKDIIEIFFLINDIYDQPVLFMGIDKTRAIYAQGRSTLEYYTYFLVGIGWIFMFVITAMTETVVLSKLKRVSRQVKDIENHGSFDERVVLSGKDELSQLATDLNKMLDALQHSTERDRNILENIADGYCETDLEGNILLINKSLCRMSKFSEDELRGMPIEQVIHPEDMLKLRESIRSGINSQSPPRRIDGKFQTKTQETGYFDASFDVVRNSQGQPVGYRSIIRDITERKHNEERLVYLAYHDALTGLYNRKAFMERMETEIAYAERYKQDRVLLFIDLDKFKEVNDTYGHAAGDSLLKMVAKRIRSELRDTDVIARMGGDEFTVLLTNPEIVSVETVTNRITEVLSRPFEINSHSIDFVSASIGSKSFPKDAHSAGELIKAADGAMYRVKNQRKHSKVCDLIERHQGRKSA